VAKLVTPPRYEPADRETWSVAEVQRFLAVAEQDRLHAA
jgi:hypothetical protein